VPVPLAGRCGEAVRPPFTSAVGFAGLAEAVVIGELAKMDSQVKDGAPSEHDFFEHMGFDPALMRKARGFYVPMFEGKQEVLDLACGRGEFLDMLGRGSGVDIEEKMVRAARDAGHDVALGDAFEYLRDRPETYDGIFSAHFVEHLPYDRAAELVGLAWRALKSGGVAVLCTPNSASLPTLQRQFWWDATHVRMYDVELLRFMLSSAGFVDVEGGVNPQNLPGYPVDLEALKVPEIGPIEQPPFLGGIIGGLDQRSQVTHHHLKIVADTLRGLIEELYTPSEIFVRGLKR
jgi:SAM-dependent methyltransferase